MLECCLGKVWDVGLSERERDRQRDSHTHGSKRTHTVAHTHQINRRQGARALSRKRVGRETETEVCGEMVPFQHALQYGHCSIN